MFELPNSILAILLAFQQLFSSTVFENAKVLLIGAILCAKQRTVSAILRVMGLKNDSTYRKYCWLLSDAKWSSLLAAKILFNLIKPLISNDLLEIIVDETFEKRKGPWIKWLGYYRNASASTKKKKICQFGLRWLSFTVLVKFPWSQRKWALPFLTILMPPSKKAASSKNRTDVESKRRKTMIKYTIGALYLIRSWEKKRPVRVVADGAFCCFDICEACQKLGIEFISRLRWDARLYEFPPKELYRGKKRVKGEIALNPLEQFNDKRKKWNKISINWYGNKTQIMEYITGTNVWYRRKAVPIRWVILRDPQGKIKPIVILSTNLKLKVKEIIKSFIDRWNIEVTFEEAHAHLGYGTQRQWSNKAIERITPAILGLFSIICLIAQSLLNEKEERLPIHNSAWYKKKEATFSDVLKYVKNELLRSMFFVRSAKKLDSTNESFEKLYALLLECG